MHGSQDLPISSLSALRDGYAARRYVPTDVVAEVLRRIDAAGEDHVWIARVSPDDLKRRVEQLQARGGEFDALPLYGVPFAVKDNMDVATFPTSAGCPAFAYAAGETAPVVQRLLNAGAILIGKTNLDQFATGLTGTRSPYGVPCNPYGGDYIPGGSSSGSAVAVASGLVTFALGTDTAGSGRVPAAFNNVVGLKPTCGLISISGIVPACRSIDCVAIFAADVESADRAFAVARGFDPGDAFSREAPQHADAHAVRRIGVVANAQREFFGDRERAANYQSFVDRLPQLGFACREFDLTPFREAAEMLYNGPCMAERDVAVGDFIRRNPDAVVPVTRDAILSASRFSAADAFRAYYRIKELRAVTRETWSHVDAICVPTTPTIYKVEQVLKDPAGTNGRLSYYTNFVNLLDLCAIAIPSGFAGGMPTGVTLIAPAFHDAPLIAAAGRMSNGGT